MSDAQMVPSSQGVRDSHADDLLRAAKIVSASAAGLPKSLGGDNEALAAFERAAQLVKQGDHAAARAVEMLLSDRQVIEQRIAASVNVANGREE